MIADRHDTVTPQNPTPPTNASCVGETPPSLEQTSSPARSPAEFSGSINEPELDPHKFAPANGGQQPEAAGTEEYDPVNNTVSTNGAYDRQPNTNHPSNPANDGQQPQPEPLTLDGLNPNEATIGDADMLLVVHGTGFTPDCVILFDGVEVETTYEKPNKINTKIRPSLATEPGETAVAVMRGEEVSSSLMFTIVEAAEPVITSLSPDETTIGDENFQIHVHGTDFYATSVIVFAGQDEPTTLNADGTLSTGINMDVWKGPDTVKVSVRNGNVMSNEVDFTFHADAGVAGAQATKHRGTSTHKRKR